MELQFNKLGQCCSALLSYEIFLAPHGGKPQITLWVFGRNQEEIFRKGTVFPSISSAEAAAQDVENAACGAPVSVHGRILKYGISVDYVADLKSWREMLTQPEWVVHFKGFNAHFRADTALQAMVNAQEMYKNGKIIMVAEL